MPWGWFPRFYLKSTITNIRNDKICSRIKFFFARLSNIDIPQLPYLLFPHSLYTEDGRFVIAGSWVECSRLYSTRGVVVSTLQEITAYALARNNLGSQTRQGDAKDNPR